MSSKQLYPMWSHVEDIQGARWGENSKILNTSTAMNESTSLLLRYKGAGGPGGEKGELAGTNWQGSETQNDVYKMHQINTSYGCQAMLPNETTCCCDTRGPEGYLWKIWHPPKQIGKGHKLKKMWIKYIQYINELPAELVHVISHCWDTRG